MTKKELYEKAKMLPLLPGVYIISDKSGEIIYIGKAKRLRTRVSQYFRDGVPHDEKVTKMINNAFSFDVIVTHTEFEALVLECSQIKQHKPRYNILLKDDKGYSYVKITREEYPRITACFASELDKKSTFIGPFMSNFAVSEMVSAANDVFKLPRCNRKFPQDFGKGRPCLNAHIGKCMAVCTGAIDAQTYAETIDSAQKMLKNSRQEIIEVLNERMQAAAERTDFEKAALVRDQIRALEKLSTKQKIIRSEVAQQDVFAFVGSANAACAAILRFREGRLFDKREFVFYDSQNIDDVREEFIQQYYYSEENDIPKSVAVDVLPKDAKNIKLLLSDIKKSNVQLYSPKRGDVLKLVDMAKTNAAERLAREHGRFTKEQKQLDEMTSLLGLGSAPEYIESYDISNWGDGTSVAGMVVFKNGKPFKAGYRRFKIISVQKNDDYTSMREALVRRVNHFGVDTKGQFAQKPDLILLDGGKGQVSTVIKALASTPFADVPIFGMVKDAKHRTRGLITSMGEEITLAMNKGVFTFITSIQDETHRFANDYRKRLQKSQTYSSTLQNVPGVGPKTAKALMAHFKTVGAVRNASENELCGAKGVSKAAAKAVFNFFNTED